MADDEQSSSPISKTKATTLLSIGDLAGTKTGPSFKHCHVPDPKDVERFQELTKAHVESFNYMLEEGLKRGVKDLELSANY